jgi:hypothetical protein
MENSAELAPLTFVLSPSPTGEAKTLCAWGSQSYLPGSRQGAAVSTPPLGIRDRAS